ncbi:MAG: bi-domain-containing oxidoreductase [Methanophagales archaeon]|nr:bi-domain-containing oxidoreductase [Methanophagales archaeon]
MKQIFTKSGSIVTGEVPAPVCGDNEVLVCNSNSLISAGTETMSLQSGGKGVVGLASKAISNPDWVHKAIEMVKRDGISKTIRDIKGQTGKMSPLGYSSSGVVLEAGKIIRDIAVGDRVACAGAGYASHAEIVRVPRNLVCKIPDNIDFDEAAFTTVGTIAMQGIRRAQVQFGDNVVVIGLGLLGQIASQILKAAGAHVIGIDIMKERVELAKELGGTICFTAGKDAADKVLKYTDGIGADSVIIYAAAKSSEPVKQAMAMARKKGRVVVVGAVGMTLDRSPFYEKELDFLISCSYGPGRYDSLYEEKGVDYPIGYVRWTENRNMQEFLKMVSEKKVNVKRLIDHVFPIEEAAKAYETLNTEKRPIGVLFQYTELPKKELVRKTQLKPSAIGTAKINAAVIGAGGFAQAYHLPNLKKISYYTIKAIVTRTGSNAKKMAEEYGAEYCTTDYKEVLKDADVNMIVIATRHNLHAPIIVEAANAGKHIFVEKPIAMSYEDCKTVYDAVTENEVNLTIDFNRRFAPLAQRAKRIVEHRINPLMITYRINSAGMKKEHWINDPVEGGGAIIGEGCHFFDFCNWIVGRDPVQIYAETISSNDESMVDANNVISTIRYEDGSVASIIYTTMGNDLFSKERIEIFVDHGVIAIEDFKELIVTGLDGKGEKSKRIEKGQFELINEYGKLLKGEYRNTDLPSVDDGVKATICSLKVLDALKTGKVQEWDYS